MLSQRLKISRKRLKLTQEELAYKVSTTKSTISNYENGHSTPSNEMLIHLSDVLQVSTDYLLGKSSSMEPNKKDASSVEDRQTSLMFDGWLEMSEEQRQEALDFMEYLRSKKNRGGK